MSVVSALAVYRPAESLGFGGHTERLDQVRYHIGRGRRAREAGQYEQGAREARQALARNASDPWALALLGQCLHQQRPADLPGARLALERAWSLDPTNGYFVGLLLDVLADQGDTAARNDLITWAWWKGAPVERWMPDGPPIEDAADVAHPTVPNVAVTSESAPQAIREQRPLMPVHA